MSGTLGSVSGRNSRRLRVFLRRPIAVLSLALLCVLGGLGLGAEWVSNSAPIIASIHGRIILPAYATYNRQDVGLEGAGTIDFRELRAELDWSLWPLLDWDPFENDFSLEETMSGPSKSHLMGTDEGGRDVFARLIYGTRVSFAFAIAVWILTFLLGTALGMLQGYFGGKVDLIGQRLTEVFSSTPEFYILLFLISVLSPNLPVLIGLSALFGWVSIGQHMRAQALQNRAHVYCEAALALGASRTRILFRHVLPNSLVPLITFSSFAIVGGINALAGLDLLGFGVPAPTPSWGELLDQARRNAQVAWWLVAFPFLFLFGTIVSLNFVGEGLRAAFDPRSQ